MGMYIIGLLKGFHGSAHDNSWNCHGLSRYFVALPSWHIHAALPWEPMAFHGLTCTDLRELSRGFRGTIIGLHGTGCNDIAMGFSMALIWDSLSTMGAAAAIWYSSKAM